MDTCGIHPNVICPAKVIFSIKTWQQWRVGIYNKNERGKEVAASPRFCPARGASCLPLHLGLLLPESRCLCVSQGLSTTPGCSPSASLQPDFIKGGRKKWSPICPSFSVLSAFSGAAPSPASPSPQPFVEQCMDSELK